MHGGFRQLRFGVKRLAPATARYPRAAQRAAAEEIVSKLGEGWLLTSRSHARGLAAVAVANTPVTRLGVDIEYADPARPWRDIAAFYLPGVTHAGLGPVEACRAWTFGEACFKAFGEPPASELLARIARAPPHDDEPIAFQSRRWWWSEDAGEDFVLSLVWEEAI